MKNEDETEAKEAKAEAENEEVATEVATEDEAEDEAETEVASTVEVIHVERPEMEVTATEPVVIVLTWAMTYASGRIFAGTKLQKARHLLPIVALFSAVAFQAIMETVGGTELGIESIGKALGAAGLAVLGHSQFREFKKAIAKNDSEEPVTEED